MHNIPQDNKSKKIFFLYALLVLGFLLFLAMMFFIAAVPRHTPSLYTHSTIKAKRGEIITADDYHVAITKKLYKAVVNTHFIKSAQENLFIKLFSIYSGLSPREISAKLHSKHGVVVLSYEIDSQHAQSLRTLGTELIRLGVFKDIKNPITHIRTVQGLSIIPSGEARVYPYKTMLTPIIGYTHKIEDDGYTTVHGIKGLEKEYDSEMSPKKDGREYGPRDVNNYIILNGKSVLKQAQNGLSIKLNIPANIQLRVEHILDEMKTKLKAKQITAVIMSSDNGKILAFASSNRYLPEDIHKSDYPSLNTAAIESAYEPGSVLKPLTFSILLQKHLVNPYELVNGYNGTYHLGNMTIKDDDAFAWLSAENVIVYSSNIGMAQLAQRLSGLDFYNGLRNFGLSYKTGIDLAYEDAGSIPSSRKLNNQIYKATTSYGYGVKVTLMQLVKAYNAFNNKGVTITPRIVAELINQNGKVTHLPDGAQRQVISPATALIMKKILIKTVLKGTGQAAIVPGIEIGGKTGTAHRVVKGKYVNRYNSTFIGFANGLKHKYTIGISVFDPHSRDYYAAGTAVPTFRKIVEMLIAQQYLKPNIVK